MIVPKTQVQIHEETRDVLNDIKMKAYRKGLIVKPSANEAIMYLLSKVGDKVK